MLQRGLRALLLVVSVALPIAPSAPAGAADTELDVRVETLAADVEERVIAWRRDIHANPELGNREERTSALVAAHLERLGYEVRRQVAHTGVVGVLVGGRPGPVVALRADMDALPVSEEVDVPYASKVRSTYLGREVGVMHACGHDTHVAILMGAAEVLAALRAELPGTVKLIFQPAEEGAPPGESGGASLMIAEGALADPKPDAIFGLHITQGWRTGEVAFKSGGLLAAAERFELTVTGRQTHAAQPWAGVDPILVSAQIVSALQSIVARQLDITAAPAVITVGTIHGGVRHNIIPDQVEMTGTIRSFEPDMRQAIHDRLRRTAEHVASAAGATATLTISPGVPVTYNHAELTARMRPTLERVYGKDGVVTALPVTGAEDFSFFQEQVPGFFFFIGGRPPSVPRTAAIPNHSPRFYVDEDALLPAVRAMASLAVDFLSGGP